MRIVLKSNDELIQFMQNLDPYDRTHGVNAIRTTKGIETYTNVREYNKRCKRFPDAVQGKLTPHNMCVWRFINFTS